MRQATVTKLVKITGKSVGALLRIPDVQKFIEAVKWSKEFSFTLDGIKFKNMSGSGGTSFTPPGTLLAKNFWAKT